MSDSQNSEPQTPESPSYKVVWERDTLERLAFATLQEQRNSRRWRIFSALLGCCWLWPCCGRA